MKIGQILYGYCGGVFGRDSYENKRVEAIGIDWIIAREIDSGLVCFAHESDHEQIIEDSNRWQENDEHEEHKENEL